MRQWSISWKLLNMLMTAHTQTEITLRLRSGQDKVGSKDDNCWMSYVRWCRLLCATGDFLLVDVLQRLPVAQVLQTVLRQEIV